MNDKNLKDFLNEHFVYEINMLHYSSMRLAYHLKEKDQNGINMSLEDFLLHGRNLLEFFYYKQTDNYVRASHFINNDEWRKNKPSKTKNIIELEKRSSKELVHLTFDRISGMPPEKLWNYYECLKDLLILTKIFLNLLPKKFYGSEIINLKDNIDSLTL